VQLKLPMDAAAEFASKLQDATRTTEGDMMGLMDVIQRTFYLGVDHNNMLEAFAKLSPAMSIIKKQGLDAAGVFAPLIVMADQAGMRGEAAGNAWRKVFQSSLDVKKLSKANEALKGTGINLDFSNGKGEFGGMDKLFANMDKLKKLTTQKRISVIKELFGDDAETLQAVSLMIDKGKSGYEDVQAKMAAQADIQRRVNEQLGTLKSLWDAASGTFTNALVSFGETIAPEVKSLTQWIGDMSAKLSAFAQEHPVLAGAMMKTVAVLAILLAGMGALGIGVAAVIGPFAIIRYGLMMLGIQGVPAIGMIKMIGNAFIWLGRALLMNPLGLAITALAGAAYLIYRNWEPIKAFFINLWDGITEKFNTAVSYIKDKFSFLQPLLNLIPGGKLALAAVTAVAGTGAAQAEPIKFNNKPPITAQRAAAQMPPGSTISIAVHAAPGMNEEALAKHVAKQLAEHERQKTSRARSSLSDTE
jgi:TP901 family phage tail tape measure protein